MSAAYSLAQSATAALRQNPADPSARAQYAAALRALGLAAAADFFTAAPNPCTAGQIPWSSRRRRFAANLRAAVERHPALAALETFWDAHSRDFQLHQSTDGNYHILKLSNPDFHTAWMAGLADHRAQAQTWSFDKSATPIPPPFAFDGAAHGWFLLHIAAATERSFLNYSAALYLLEPDPIALCILLHLHDLQILLRHPRLRLFAGPSALADFQFALRQNPSWSIPRQFVTARLTAPGIPQLQSTAEALINERQSAAEALSAQIQSRLNARNLAYWQTRFSHHSFAPLRVLAITTRFSTVLRWSMEELAAAITAAGHQVQIVMEPDDHSLENGLLAKLHDFNPDLLLLISRLRHENPLLPRDIPFICWDQDNLPCMRTPEATASLDRFTYIAGHATIFGQAVLNWPAQNCLPCFPAAAGHRYQPRPLTPEESARFTSDFSYVSNASGAPESLQQSQARIFAESPTATALFQSLTTDFLARSREGERFDQIALEAFIRSHSVAQGLSLPPNTIQEFTILLRTLADRCFRHAALEWVAAYCARHNRTLHLYGTGWEAHPTLAPFAKGRIDPGDSLTAIYRATRINLQIIESGPIHSRFLDGIAAGGFFLVRESTLPHERSLADAQFALAQRAADLHITTGQQLLTTPDPEILRLWQAVRHTKSHCTPVELTAALRHWLQLPPAHLALPHIDAITFHNQETFNDLANRFLSDPTLRTRIAADLRRHILQQHSYDTRWQQFLTLVQNGLV